MEVQTKPPRPPLNGVDTPMLLSTINAVAGQPDLGRFQFRADNRWIEGTHSRSAMSGYYGAGAEQKREQTHFADGDHTTILCGTDHGSDAGRVAAACARGLHDGGHREHRGRARREADESRVACRRGHRPARHPRHLERCAQRLRQACGSISRSKAMRRRRSCARSSSRDAPARPSSTCLPRAFP